MTSITNLATSLGLQIITWTICVVLRDFFYFFYFLFSFFTKNIYFRFRNLQKYTPSAPLPGDRDLVAPLRGGRGFCAKNFAKIFARRSLRAGRPAAGRPALACMPDDGARGRQARWRTRFLGAETSSSVHQIDLTDIIIINHRSWRWFAARNE